MLLEAIQYLTTPCPRPYRAMGYLHELIATGARARRCRAAWQPHLDKTRAVISDAVAKSGGNTKAVVLGAGMLGDIPLDRLAQKFATVVLADVCFSKQTRRVVWRHPHIELLHTDITGVAGAVHRGEIPVPGLPAAPSLADADLVVSANVVSQLPLIPLKVLRRKLPQPDDAALQAFAQGIVRAHLEWLKTCPGTVCLISEVERRFIDAENIIGHEDPLWGVVLEPAGAIATQEWFWDIAPKPEAAPDYAIRNRVQGMVWQGA